MQEEYRPLADALRPRELDDVVGQSHILGEGGLLRRIIESGKIPNMIFYGPSGTGKTTVRGSSRKRPTAPSVASTPPPPRSRTSGTSSRSWTPS